MSGRTHYCRSLRVLSACCGVLASAGCASTQLHMREGQLDTRTEMAEAIFLEPRSNLSRTLFLEVRNSSGVDVSLDTPLASALTSAGLELVTDPEEATYLLQLHVLQMSKVDLGDDMSLEDALNSALMAGTATAIAADLLGSNSPGAWGLAAGALGFLIDASTRHAAYLLTADVQLIEAVAGVDGMEERIHATRIVSGADKVDLEADEAMRHLEREVAKSIAGIFAPTAATGLAAPRQP